VFEYVSKIIRETRMTMNTLLNPDGLWRRILAIWILGLLAMGIIVSVRLPEILLAVLAFFRA